MSDDIIPVILAPSESLGIDYNNNPSLEDVIVFALEKAHMSCFGVHMTIELVKKEMDAFLDHMNSRVS